MQSWNPQQFEAQPNNLSCEKCVRFHRIKPICTNLCNHPPIKKDKYNLVTIESIKRRVNKVTEQHTKITKNRHELGICLCKRTSIHEPLKRWALWRKKFQLTHWKKCWNIKQPSWISNNTSSQLSIVCWSRPFVILMIFWILQLLRQFLLMTLSKLENLVWTWNQCCEL